MSGLLDSKRTRVTPERLENFAGKREIAVVGFESEALVGFDGVEAGVLQLVRLKFRHEADAAALLLFVDEDARAFLGDHRQ